MEKKKESIYVNDFMDEDEIDDDEITNYTRDRAQFEK
jgi:hypothetical protein